MNILYFVNQYPKISHTFIRREIQGLESLGYSVNRVALRPGPEVLVDDDDISELNKTEFIVIGSKIFLVRSILSAFISSPYIFFDIFLKFIIFNGKSSSGLIRRIICFAEACALKGIASKHRADHIHAHFGTNSSFIAMLCRKLGGPSFSFTVHGPEEFDDPKGLQLGENIATASFVVAISEYCRSQLMRWCDYRDWEKIKIVRCSVDNTLLVDLKSIDSDRMISIGRLCEQKGQMVLLQAISELKKEGVEVSLDLVGDGESLELLQSYVEENNIRENVIFHGWQGGEQIKKLIDGASTLVLPSFAEGLPVVIMESFARGRPVISTYIAAIPEIIQDNANGWLVYPGDLVMLKCRIRMALDSTKEQLEEMGQLGREIVAERHNNITEAAKLAKLIEDHWSVKH